MDDAPEPANMETDDGWVGHGWYWHCRACGKVDAGYVSQEAALANLARHTREECPL